MRTLGAILGGLLVVAGSVTPAAAQATGPTTPTRLPRGDYESYWRQVDGPWMSQLTRTTLQGCAYPAEDACGRPAGGPFVGGATVAYNAFGCVRAPITIRCVVQKAGTGQPGVAGRGRLASGRFASGRYELRTGATVAVVDLTVNGRRFSGFSDPTMPGRAKDPIVDGRVLGRSIFFRRLCEARTTCVQRYRGTLIGDRARGLMTVKGARRPVSWTLEPR
ncbi:hypothetical protein [Pinisolibacter sp.]|uniref:hypothetical protein n=1 Tax=Pinisolibacter sp. TaxID=2172024 RepID=UPI002FDDF184